MGGLTRLVGAGRLGVSLAQQQQQTIVSDWSGVSRVRGDMRKTMIMRFGRLFGRQVGRVGRGCCVFGSK
jgi:hypothetical protein